MQSLLAWIDRRYVKIAAHAIVAALITFALGLALWNSTDVFVKLWQLICAVVEPLVYGAMISYLLQPLVRAVTRWLNRTGRFEGREKQLHSSSIILALALVTLVIITIIVVLLALITHSLSSISFATLQAVLDSAQGDLSTLLDHLQERLGELGLTQEDGNSLMGAVGNVSSMISTATFSVIFAVYFLFDGDRILAYGRRLSRALVGSRTDTDHSDVLADLNRVFSGYFRGQALDALVVGALSGVVLTIVGVPYGPVVGLLAGLGNLIPYVGGPVGFGSLILICLAEGAWQQMAYGIVAMALVMVVDSNVINPRLLSDNVEVHPMLVVVALIAGGSIGGIAGMLVAVPIAAFIKIQLDHWIEGKEQDGDNLVDELSDELETLRAARSDEAGHKAL